jgi:tetratricopeptide (TPR) repeat protein
MGKGTANMVDIFKALGWLNAIDNRSYLNQRDRRLIEAIGKLGLFDFQVGSILDSLRTAVDSPGESLRKAEVLLWCAAVGHARGECAQAARDANEAVIDCDTDDHRRAAALWIVGIIQWELCQNQEAFRNWGEAKRIFKQRQNPLRAAGNAEDWYQDPLWQMDVDLIARPEEISTWLNCFHPSSLRPPTLRIVESMREKIRQRAYPTIYVLMQDLEAANQQSRRVYERGEIYLEFGLATYQLGNSRFAVELLRQAVSDFYPGIGICHKQVVARCMLGALEWMHKSLHSQASADWLRCVDELEQLGEWADRENLDDKEKWYSDHCDILRSALLDWLEPSK